MLTNEDRDIVRTAVMLPMIIQMLEKDIEQLKQSKQTFRPAFIKSAEMLRQVIETDLRNTRRELSKRGIRIIEEDTDSRSSKLWKIIQRGNEEVMEILRPTIRLDIGERIAAYNEGMFNVIPGPQGNNENQFYSRVNRDGLT
jgi:hypothetical protein